MDKNIKDFLDNSSFEIEKDKSVKRAGYYKLSFGSGLHKTTIRCHRTQLTDLADLINSDGQLYHGG